LIKRSCFLTDRPLSPDLSAAWSFSCRRTGRQGKFIILLICSQPAFTVSQRDLPDSKRLKKAGGNLMRSFSNRWLRASMIAFNLLACMLSTSFADRGDAAETTANTQAIPAQILKTGISLTSKTLAPNSIQLADTIGLTPLLERIQKLRPGVLGQEASPSLEKLAARQDLRDTLQDASLLVQRTNLDIDFTIAEIEAEQQVYEEILSTFSSDRDKLLARVNAASFISNGILWAACEGLSIPSIDTTFAKNPRHVVQWPVPSGIVGIAAGIVPSIASMYTLKAVNGKKLRSESNPNMLAKLFGYPAGSDIDYPDSVWKFLHQVPAGEGQEKKRLDQIVDRWIADANMPDFTDRNSKKQLDVLTASVSQPRGLSIATLTARIIMLKQLHAEICKMKRMLLELTMTVQGEKEL
jgi:hypothetical protein